MKKIKNHLEQFFTVWGFILVANQIFIFHGCFAPYCILAALPHTGIIAFFVTLFLVKDEKEQNRKEYTSNERLSDFQASIKETQRKRAELRQKKVLEQEDNKSTIKENATYFQSDESSSIKYENPKSIFDERVEPDPLKEMGDNYEKYIGKQFESKGELVIYNGLIYGYEDKGVDLISISEVNKSINLVQCKNWHKKEMLPSHIQDVYNKLDIFKFEGQHYQADIILDHLTDKVSKNKIQNLLNQVQDFTIRKTLYVASDKIVNLDVGQELQLIKPNIFRYKDMKIVFLKMYLQDEYNIKQESNKWDLPF